MTTTETETKIRKTTSNTNTKETIEEIILNSIKLPKNYDSINAINLFDNRWRINVYSATKGFITKKTIEQSFYAIYNDNVLTTYPNTTVRNS